MLIFKAIIDEYTCDVCKELDGKEFNLNDALIAEWECENENCRCVIASDCRPYNYRQDLSV